MAIAHEGMTGKYGLGIGRVIRENYSHDMLTRMRSLTAAASEARMGGCDMPVVINSGSGNQGIACSVPLIVYAREMELPDYSLYRALVFSNLLTVYQKQYIGKLSAFCGAVSASCAAGAAITYMVGGDISLIKKRSRIPSPIFRESSVMGPRSPVQPRSQPVLMQPSWRIILL